MGNDLVAGGKSKKAKRTAPKSDDIYFKLLVKLYRFLVRWTGSKFNAVVLKRFFMRKVNKPPLSLSRLICFTQGKVTALRFTETVRARILKAGGDCLAFDQLALMVPLGQNTCATEIVNLGLKNSREAVKHFGKAPGVPHGHTKPYARSKGQSSREPGGRGIAGIRV